jgi:hypothetical protein
MEPAAQPAVQQGRDWSLLEATQESLREHMAEIKRLKAAQPAPVQEPVAWTDLLKQAEEVVRSKSLWKKYIDGTPLANDIAVWMANFAQEHTTPPAPQPVPVKTYHDGKPWPVQPKHWVGLTNNELQPIADEYRILFGGWVEEFARAIEAKLKEKNT